MTRRRNIIATVALGLLLTAGSSTSVGCRFVTSARSFQYHFRDLKQAGHSFSPFQRLVLSLMLANGNDRI